MDFSSMIKGDLSEKYSQMLDGSTSITNNDIRIQDSSDFISHFNLLTNRLKEEVKDVNNAIEKINGKKSDRLYKEKQESNYQKAIKMFNLQNFQDALKEFKNLAQYKDSASWVQKCQEELNIIEQKERAKREAECSKKRKKEILLKILKYGLAAIPLILTIVFAVILFSNIDQISIVSNFVGWCIGWVFILIGNIVLYNALFKKKVIVASVSLLLIVVLTIVGFVNSAKLTKSFEPTTFISFEATGKTTEITSMNYYDSTISFKLTNNSNVKVTSIYGEMKLYNGPTEVSTWNVRFTGDYLSGKTYNTTVKFEEKETTKLYNTSFTNLGITYRITSMKFNDYYTEYEYDGDVITIKSKLSSSDIENNYQMAMSLHRQRKYTEARVIFESLGDYKDSISYAEQCEEKEMKQDMETYLHNVAGSNAELPDDYDIYMSFNYNDYIYYNSSKYTAFFCDLKVPSKETDTYIARFINKLTSKGFSLVDTNTYKKGTTMIKFTDIKFDYYGYYIDYYAWKMQ